MKKFWKENKGFIIVVLSLVLIIVLSLFIEGNTNKNEASSTGSYSSDILEWLEANKGDEPVVTVIAQTTCSHCMNFKPVIQKVQGEYGFKLYWFEADEMSSEDYKTLTGTYDLQSYVGTPHTFIVKGDKLIAEKSGETTESNLISFLKEYAVIK